MSSSETSNIRLYNHSIKKKFKIGEPTIIGFDSNYLIEITGGVELDIKELLRIAIRINKTYRMFVDTMSTMDSLIRVGMKIRLYTFPMNVCLFI